MIVPKYVILVAAFSVALFGIAPSACASDACTVVQQNTFCALGRGRSASGNVLINRGEINATKVFYTQNEDSTSKCATVGETDVHVDLRVDGDALTEVDSGRFIQVIGLANALGANKDVTEGSSPVRYTISKLNTDVNSGVEIEVASPILISLQHGAAVVVSLRLNGMNVALPARCQ